MIEVDRAMIEDYGISLVRMMENAGRNLAHLARQRFLAGAPAGKAVVVLAGSGGNGGGALVAARRLHNWGAKVTVFLTRAAADLTRVPAQQLAILQQMGVPCDDANLPLAESCELVLDGLIGYSLRGAPRGRAASLISWAGQQATPILALDTPSGLDADCGQLFLPAIEARATMTLALPKTGLVAPVARTCVGELYLADISVPPALYQRPPFGLDVGPLFASSEILRLS
jgi:NAD(P)H-hydrate epimerase